jgi:hypothetical protein
VYNSDLDDGLLIRRDAAIKLVLERELTGWDALWLVVAPPPTLANIGARRQQHREVVRVEARRLHAAGLTGPEVARELGVPYRTVKSWLWPAACEKQKQRRQERARLRREQMAA